MLILRCYFLVKKAILLYRKPQNLKIIKILYFLTLSLKLMNSYFIHLLLRVVHLMKEKNLRQ